MHRFPAEGGDDLVVILQFDELERPTLKEVEDLSLSTLEVSSHIGYERVVGLHQTC